MTVRVVNLDPANFSSSNARDEDVTFTITGASDDDISSLEISSHSDIIFRDKSFFNDYSGSSYSQEGDSYDFSITKSGGFSEGSNVFFKLFIEDKLNFEYQIGLLPYGPYLYYKNISDGDVIDSPKKIFLQFDDVNSDIDVSTIDVVLSDYNIIKDGTVDSRFAGYTTIENSSFLKINIDHPEYFRNGDYILKYSVANSNSDRVFGQIKFSIKLKKVLLPSTFPQVSFSGANLGLKSATNTGSGGSVSVKWNKFISRSPKSEMMSMLYLNKDRLSLFESLPSYIFFGDVTSATINNLDNGFAYSFAVRGLEAFKGTFSEEGLVSNSGGGYVFPSSITLSETLLDSDRVISVDTTEGYPNSGLLIVGNSEVIKYTSTDSNSFYVSSSGRGLNNTKAALHALGSEVSLFVKCQDKNTNIVVSTPAFTWGNDPQKPQDRVGELVTDFSEDDKRFFQGFDYCGYHQALPDKILEGNDNCGSYLGGEFNGNKGFNIFDRVNARNEVLLEQVGEPCILLKRKWAGTVCDCMDLRREHPRNKTCIRCFGTGYVGGYDIYSNLRRNDRKVLLRFKETKEELEHHPSKHLNINMTVSCWTMPLPAIKERDIIVRFDFVNSFEYMYEVLDVTKERFVYKHYGRQSLNLQKMDRTDIVYTFDYEG